MENKVFKKVQSFSDVLLEHFQFSGKTVIDVGCGTGDLVRWLASQGANVYGIDLPKLIEKANSIQKVHHENYLVGTAQDMTFESNFADLVIFMASFHHVPEIKMPQALSRCYNILKPNGYAVILEPVLQEDSYFKLTSLVEDERYIQMKAYEFIKDINPNQFRCLIEDYFFTERSFQDFLNLLSVYVPDVEERTRIINRAKDVVKKDNGNIETVRYQSRVRLNILQKI